MAAIEAEGDALLGERLRMGESYGLQTRFLVHRAGLWTFLHDPAVPPTNNSSEQALGPLVIHRGAADLRPPPYGIAARRQARPRL
ncbi:MAG TPA: transposase [Dehalococcoidia bacterium]|nr:transposase [Dehalococcoidia bacterium]